MFHVHQQRNVRLTAFTKRLSDTSLLVTFNGQRMISVCGGACILIRFQRLPPHLDLLPVTKKLWKNRLPNCKLQTLERVCYGYKREGDLPGSEMEMFIATS